MQTETQHELDAALLDSTLFGGLTEIPVKEWLGPDGVIFNRKTGNLCYLDLRGHSILEPGGIYTCEDLGDEEIRKRPFENEVKIPDKGLFKMLSGGNKTKRFSSGFSSGTFSTGSSTPKSRRESETPSIGMGTVRTTSLGISFKTKKRSSRQDLDPSMMDYEKRSSMRDLDPTLLVGEKRLSRELPSGPPTNEKRLSKNEILVNEKRVSRSDIENGSFAEKGPFGNEMDPTIIISSEKRVSRNDLEASMQQLEKRTTKIEQELSSINLEHSTTDSSLRFVTESMDEMSDMVGESGLSRSIVLKSSPLSKGGKKSSLKDLVFAGALQVFIDGNFVECFAKVEGNKLHVMDSSDAVSMFEIILSNCLTVVDFQSSDFKFIVKTPTGQYSFLAESYQKMAEWIGFLNSYALKLNQISRDYLALNAANTYAATFLVELNALLKEFESETGIVHSSDFVEYDKPSDAGIESYIPQITSQHSDIVKSPLFESKISLKTLVEILTNTEHPDLALYDVMRYAFRAFASPEELLSRLMDRVTVEGVEEQMRPLIKIRTIKLVWDWLKSFSAIDFISKEMKNLLFCFLEKMMENLPASAKGSGNLSRGLRNCQRYLEYTVKMGPGAFKQAVVAKPRASRNQRSGSMPTGGKYATLPQDAPATTDKSKGMTSLDFDCEDLVAELTRKEYEFTKAVTIEMLTLNLWGSQKDNAIKEYIKPIQDSIEFFNTISYWVATEICTQPEMKKRVKVIEKYIKIACKLFKLNNFNTTMGIVSGLNLMPVSRLKLTWEQVDQKRTKQLNTLEETLSPMGNYKNYRVLLDDIDPSCPCIPILSIFLKDLLFANDGNSNFQEKTDLINISKFTTIMSRIMKFCAFSQNSYLLKMDGNNTGLTEDYCRALRTLKDAPLYKYSCLCEPKNGDDSLILRSKWMSSS